MGCCGKAVRKARNIVTGYTNYARGVKYKFTDSRVRECHGCDEQTWMSKAEYAAWLARHGIKVIANFTQLEKLPKLPKYEYGPKRKNLYCRLCKCFIPVKASKEEEECLLGKWEGI